MMFNPEVTLRILRYSALDRPSYWTWGVKAVGRRVMRCCADNVDCIKAAECRQRYDIWVNATKNHINLSEERYHKPGPSVIETYKFHGLHRIVNPDMVRC